MPIKKKTAKSKNVTVKCICHNCGTKNGQIYEGETIVTTREDAEMLVQRGMVEIV